MSKPALTPPLLCLITNPTMPDLLKKVERALTAGVNMLQLRGHQLSAAELYRLAFVLHPICRQSSSLLIVNDRIDVGLAIGADGFQLGARSLPLAIGRHLVGEEHLLGVSIHSCAEAQEAVASGADFLLAGTIFPSRSHPGEPTAGCDLLRSIKQRCPAHPLLAIGGITTANAHQVIEAGADGIAVISAILDAPDIEQAVSDLKRVIHLATTEKESR